MNGPPIIHGPKPKIPPPFFGPFPPGSSPILIFNADGQLESIKFIPDSNFEDKAKDAGFDRQQTWVTENYVLSTQLEALNAVSTRMNRTVGETAFGDIRERVLKLQSIVEAANESAGDLYQLVLDRLEQEDGPGKGDAGYGEEGKY